MGTAACATGICAAFARTGMEVPECDDAPGFQKFKGRTEVVCVVTSESDVFVHAMMAENGGEQEVVGAGCYGARRECAGRGAWIGICVLITNSGFIRSR
jgi:hypothetical protein